MTDNSGSANAGNPGAPASGNDGAGGGGTPPAPWYGTVEDAELRGFAELKGWKNPADALKSYRDLEKFQGAPPEQLLRLPANADDKAAWGEVHKRLGFAPPEKADDYGLAQIEGFDPAFVTGAQQALHKHGVPKDMAGAVMKDIGAQLVELETAFNTQRQTQFEGELSALKTEWGGKFDELVETGKRAAAEYMPKAGLEQGDMDAIRDAIGQAKFNKLWAGIGSTMGEAAFHEGGQGSGSLGPMTPDAALVKRNQLVQDQDFLKRYQSGDVRAVAEWNRVNEALAHSAASTGQVR